MYILSIMRTLLATAHHIEIVVVYRHEGKPGRALRIVWQHYGA
jgi:hypothetical protein